MTSSVSFAGAAFPVRDTFSLFRGCQPFTDSDYAAEVMADSPVGYWQMQDCGDFPQDSSGNDRDFTDYVASPTMAYRRPGALTHPLDKCVFLPFLSNPRRTGAVSTAVNNVTIEGWFKIKTRESSFLGSEVLFHVGASGSNGYGWYIHTDLTINVLLGGIGYGSAAADTALTLDTWTHLVMRRNAGTWEYFKDGVADGTGGTTAPNTPSNQVFMEITGEYSASHIAVYETALSDARIAAHYAAR